MIPVGKPMIVWKARMLSGGVSVTFAPDPALSQIGLLMSDEGLLLGFRSVQRTGVNDVVSWTRGRGK